MRISSSRAVGIIKPIRALIGVPIEAPMGAMLVVGAYVVTIRGLLSSVGLLAHAYHYYYFC